MQIASGSGRSVNQVQETESFTGISLITLNSLKVRTSTQLNPILVDRAAGLPGLSKSTQLTSKLQNLQTQKQNKESMFLMSLKFGGEEDAQASNLKPFEREM